MPLKKIGKAIGKVVKKVVPKEIAGIMQVAAPFTGAAAPFVYAAGAYKQSGRINPMVAASLAAPYLRFGGNQPFRYGSAQAGDFGIRNLLFGGRGVEKSLFDPAGFGGTADKFLFGSPATEDSFGVGKADMDFGTESGDLTFFKQGEEATRGILGAEGKFDLKQSKLIRSGGVGDNKLNKTNIAALVAGGASLATTTQEIEEEGIEEGLPSDEIARLQAEAAEMWKDFDTTAFKPNVKNGGLMRVKLNKGTPKPTGLSGLMGRALDDFEEDEILIERDLDKANKPVIVIDSKNKKPNFVITLPGESKDMDFEPIILRKGNKFIVVRGDGEEEIFDSREAAERYLKQVRPFKKGGRVKLREGSEGNELPPDPTTPVNPFKPKPIGPVLPNKAQMVDPDILRQMFLEALKNGEIPPGTDFDTYKDMMMTLMSKTQAKQGGLMRSNFALGTKPTREESGLGGLPIEADMRYSGGFMPYGAKEKADDVPARLSKNEFVFTADAVRAAGGGSVQKGAQKMYNTMKQLESMGAMA